MTITENDWLQLEASPGTHGLSSRLVDPHATHDLYLLVRQPEQRRILSLRTQQTMAEQAMHVIRQLPRTGGLELEFIASGPGRSELHVSLIAVELREVFNALVNDMISAAAQTSDGRDAILAIVGRFEHWRRLLAAVSAEGLLPEWRRGLAGELVVLRDTVLPAVGVAGTVAAWTGPTGAPQDYQLPGGAIEVKTTAAKQPQTLVITNERELDDTGVQALLLVHLSVDERQGGDGYSLNRIVDDIRGLLGAGPAHGRFEELLIRAGYLPAHRTLYDEPRYTVRDMHLWHVAGDFPRITEAELRPGVGDCRYRIATVGLDNYSATHEVIDRVLKGTT